MTTSRPDLVYAALSGSIDGASVFLACSKQAATWMSRRILWHVWAGGQAGGVGECVGFGRGAYAPASSSPMRRVGAMMHDAGGCTTVGACGGPVHANLLDEVGPKVGHRAELRCRRMPHMPLAALCGRAAQASTARTLKPFHIGPGLGHTRARLAACARSRSSMLLLMARKPSGSGRHAPPPLDQRQRRPSNLVRSAS